MSEIKKTEFIKPEGSVLKKIHSLKKEKGKIAAIESKSGEWFLGNTTIEAIKKAKKVFPDCIFYIIRVGHKTAGMLKKFLKSYEDCSLR